jgi:hypothetical protein
MLGGFRVVAKLAAFQEGLSSMELVAILTGNTLYLRYRDQPVNAVQANSCS